MRPTALFGLALTAIAGGARSPAPASVAYALRIDSAGSQQISVEMRIAGAPPVFRVAMSTHAEYDDQYWRYVADVHGESPRGAVTITREDSATWRVNAPLGDVTIRYRVQFPASPSAPRPSWQGHLTTTGGLVGGPHSFMYVVGGERAPVRVTLALPPGWKIATGLDATAGVYAAADAEALIDSPIMVGTFREWHFSVDGIPHDIALLGAAGGVAFDTAHFLASVEALSRETARSFTPMPYHRYQFLFEDGANGGLEHLNSVSIGVQSTNLARDPDAYLAQTAHEFFHTWNEVHIRPASWVGLRHVTPAPTRELWFSEGVTLYYADLLLRRAGLHTNDSTRVQRVERLMTTYFANPSHASVSPERTSLAFNMQAATGDYTPSMFTQGELLGVALDLMIREGSAGRRSLDDAMRSLAAQFSPARGIAGADIERAVSAACACDAHSFFSTYVNDAGPLDFNRWLGLIGLRATVTWAPARLADSSEAPDARVSAFVRTGEPQPRLQVWFPSTLWGRSGFHTGDQLVSWNGVAMTGVPQVRAAIGRLHIGDTVRLGVRRDAATVESAVVVSGYNRPFVRITERPDMTAAQRALLTRWLAGR